MPRPSTNLNSGTVGRHGKGGHHTRNQNNEQFNKTIDDKMQMRLENNKKKRKISTIYAHAGAVG